VEDGDAAVVVTTLRTPDGVDATALVHSARRNGEAISPGFGELAHDVIRIDHTGERARLDVVLATLNSLGGALGEETPDEVAINAALETASRAWTDELDAI
jgi:aspartate aminotransferase-like enzyme